MNNSEDKLAEIGRRIKKARKQKHMTQQQLADAVGYSFQAISKLENGKMNITVEKAQLIAEALDADPEMYIVEESVEPVTGKDRQLAKDAIDELDDRAFRALFDYLMYLRKDHN